LEANLGPKKRFKVLMGERGKFLDLCVKAGDPLIGGDTGIYSGGIVYVGGISTFFN